MAASSRCKYLCYEILMMAEYNCRIYNGLVRLPHELVHLFGDEVTIVSDYRAAVFFSPGANRVLIAKSLVYLAELIRDEFIFPAIEKRGKKPQVGAG